MVVYFYQHETNMHTTTWWGKQDIMEYWYEFYNDLQPAPDNKTNNRGDNERSIYKDVWV